MKDYQFELIKGIFDSSEAKEVLLYMIDGKIQFHNDRVFSDKVRFGTGNIESINRIKELEETRKQVLDIIANSNVSITSKISIETIAETKVA